VSKLYEISRDYDTLSGFEINSDEDLAAFQELAKAVDASFEDKAENICKMIRNFESEAEGFDGEIQRLEKAKKSYLSKAKALKAYLEFNVRQIMSEGESRKVGTFTIALQKKQDSCNVFDETTIPDEYMKREPNVAAIKEALKSGIAIDGAELVSGSSLRIK
jgi:hypothetical protein